MIILIPTYDRVDKQHTHDRLFPSVRDRWNCTLVVRPDEEGRHRAAGRRTLGCPVQGRGMAVVRQWMLDWCAEAGHGKVLMLDDDLSLQKWRLVGGVPRGRGACTEAEQHEIVGWVEKTLSTYAHCSLTRRNDAWSSLSLVEYNTRGIQAVGYNVGRVRAAGCRFDADVPPWFFMEDYHMTLQLLRAGLPNAVHRRYRINQGAADAPGGCSGHRTPDRMREASRLLESLHPGFVQAVEKTTKGSYGGGTRWDVKVFWWRAYLSSQTKTPGGARGGGRSRSRGPG